MLSARDGERKHLTLRLFQDLRIVMFASLLSISLRNYDSSIGEDCARIAGDVPDAISRVGLRRRAVLEVRQR